MKTKRYTQKEYVVWSNIRAHLRRKESAGQEIPYDEDLIDNYDLFLEIVGEAPSHRHELIRIEPAEGYFADNLLWQETKRSVCKANPHYKKDHLKRLDHFTVKNGILTVFFRNQRTHVLTSQSYYVKPDVALQFHSEGLDVGDLKLRYGRVIHTTHFITRAKVILGVANG